MVASGMAADIAALLSSTSARTLTVGLDKSGRVLQHDRAAGEVLAEVPGSLLGHEFGTLVTGSAYGSGLQALIDAACSDREGTAVLTIKTGNGHHADAVVTVQPLRSTDPQLVAQVVLRIAPPSEERFLDPAVMRHALLDGAFARTGGALDIDQMAPALVNIIVPHFCNSAGLLVLESLVGADEFPGDTYDGQHLVRRLAIAHDDDDPGWDAAFPTGEILSYPPDSPHTRCLDTGKPVMQDLAAEVAESFAKGMRRRPVARLMTGTSLLLLPLIARGTTLGFFACTRYKGYRRFDAYDTEIGMEFASRAAIFIDNARRYSRERATALTLQRSLLPTGLSAPSSVEVRHRYLPGSKMIEVGGDWYESIALPGGRVALVVGDVAGHGVRAAVTMGRLRTAIRTLARLELPPAETLQQLDELMHDLGAARAALRHLRVRDLRRGLRQLRGRLGRPPAAAAGRPRTAAASSLTSRRRRRSASGPGPIQTRIFKIKNGSLLVLYTDGLVETARQRHRRRAGPAAGDVRSRLGRPARSRICARRRWPASTPITSAMTSRCCIARLRRLAPDQHVTWKLAAELTSARRARMLVRRRLKRWGLAELIPTAELLASELVTNAVRYSQGSIALRLVREDGLVCEVHRRLGGPAQAAARERRRRARPGPAGREPAVRSAGVRGARSPARPSGVSWPSPIPEGRPRLPDSANGSGRRGPMPG